MKVFVVKRAGQLDRTPRVLHDAFSLPLDWDKPEAQLLVWKALVSLTPGVKKRRSIVHCPGLGAREEGK